MNQGNRTRSSTTTTFLSFVSAFVRSTIIRRKFFVQQIVWFPFPSFCWLSSLSLLSLKIPRTKKKKKEKKKNDVCAPDRGTMNTYRGLLLSPCYYRAVGGGSCALKGTRGRVHGVRECVELHTRLGPSTCKCQWRLKIGRLSETRNLALSSDVHTIYYMYQKSECFLPRGVRLFDDLDILLDTIRWDHVT